LIVKVQVAAQLPGMENIASPMLLYNANRSIKTFLLSDHKGYDKIKNMILKHGVEGALGAVGGKKGYFNAKVTKMKKGEDIISLDVLSGLVSNQTW